MAEMFWRKMDRSLIKNENLAYISDQLPKELAAAPWMFYYTALSIADDEGVFDLDDGIVFSRLMRVNDPSIVFTVANLLMKRNLILRANSTSSKCIIVNWGQKDSDTRTMEQRRMLATKKIEEERKAKQTQVLFSTPEENEASEPFVNFAAKPSSDLFFGPVNDKNAHNVVKEVFDDKNCENVDKTERERERQRVNPRENLERDIDREKETHTEKGLQASGMAFRPLEQEKQTEETDYTEFIERQKADEDNVSLVDEALSYGKSDEVVDKSIQTCSCFEYLEAFFARNNLGYSKDEHNAATWELAERLADLADTRNPPEIVAINFTEQFKKLIESSEFYSSYPVLPEYLLKPGCYQHVLAAVSKILLNKNSNTGAWYAQAEQFRQEAEAEKAAVGNAFEQQYIKYGIDPTDPAAAAKLLRIKANSNGG